jgi:hypothetical protein
MAEIAQRRGGNWCTAMLGRSFPGIRHVSTVDGWTLIVTDTRNLDPALPHRIVEERAATQAV